MPIPCDIHCGHPFISFVGAKDCKASALLLWMTPGNGLVGHVAKRDEWRCGGIFRAALGIALVTGLFSRAEAADETQRPGNFRASVYAGAFIPQSQSWNGTGSVSGLPFAATGKLSSNTGWAAGALLGYSFENTSGLEWL